MKDFKFEASDFLVACKAEVPGRVLMSCDDAAERANALLAAEIEKAEVIYGVQIMSMREKSELPKSWERAASGINLAMSTHKGRLICVEELP